MERDDAALADITRESSLLREFVEGYDREAFLGDRKTQRAVLCQLMIIGEAASRLSDAFRNQHPIAPWPRIVGLRNILIHRYHAVDLELVWVIAQRDIPSLIAATEPLVRREED
jgi:uncharacterized protein with HEPN domain